MRALHLVFEHSLEASRAALFAFHERPANLALLQRRWPGFRLLSHAATIETGARMEISVRFGPVWLPLTMVHFVHEPPERFGERQVRGPFRRLEHVHEFVELPAGGAGGDDLSGPGTLIRDRLDVALPWYLGGPLADRLIVAPIFRRWFAYRHAELAELVAEGLVPGAGPARGGGA